jgi:hypothetical protein
MRMAEGTDCRSTWNINEVGKEVFKNENKTKLVALSRTAGFCPLVNEHRHAWLLFKTRTGCTQVSASELVCIKDKHKKDKVAYSMGELKHKPHTYIKFSTSYQLQFPAALPSGKELQYPLDRRVGEGIREPFRAL